VINSLAVKKGVALFKMASPKKSCEIKGAQEMAAMDRFMAFFQPNSCSWNEATQTDLNCCY